MNWNGKFSTDGNLVYILCHCQTTLMTISKERVSLKPKALYRHNIGSYTNYETGDYFDTEEEFYSIEIKCTKPVCQKNVTFWYGGVLNSLPIEMSSALRSFF